ncbi:ABC-type glycerol-3-phosphate transport system substrate-binding protein [Pedobacter sp. CG_S7]|uniref:hypothetical protein n=1 Tax=Pedobacter sp. CG_S7 TaxID=3143930 RepID=UPI00339B789E
MKKTILSLAMVGSLIIATSACSSNRNASETKDSTTMDSTATPTTDTTTTPMPADTSKIMPPDTTKTMPPM